MKFMKRKSKRAIEQVNQDYLRLCAALGEKQHALSTVLPNEIKRINEEISKLRAEAETIPKPSDTQPQAETKTEE